MSVSRFLLSPSLHIVYVSSMPGLILTFQGLHVCANHGMAAFFSANLRPRPVAPPVAPTNQQEAGARPSLEEVAARWRRGGRWNLFTQRSLDSSDLEELEQTIRKMDEEDLEKEMHENYLEMEMRKYGLENVKPMMQRDNEELFVPVKTSEAHETGM